MNQKPVVSSKLWKGLISALLIELLFFGVPWVIYLLLSKGR
jgi:hypothetical protein